MPLRVVAPVHALLLLVIVALASGCAASAADPAAPTAEGLAAPIGPYLGQRAGAAPSLFAPGVISSRRGEMNAAFSPDGTELYFTIKDAADRASAIAVTRRAGDRWEPPQIAAFSGRYDDVDPAFSPDGTRLYFSSYRSRDGSSAPAADADLWYVERRDGGFGDAVHVGAPVSTPHDDFHASLTRDGTLYYSVWNSARRTSDVFRARPAGGAYQVESAGAPINTESSEYDPYVAPDESYVIFASNRPGGRGDADLYVSFRDGATWSEPVSLGDAVNTPAREYCPVVSPDGKYFLFTSKRAAVGTPATFADWTARYDAIENGLSNVYWLESDFLNALRPHRP